MNSRNQQQINQPTYNRTNQINNTHGIRLSGAARKRFLYLVKKGMDPEEAKERAMQPISQAHATWQTQQTRAQRHTFKGINPPHEMLAMEPVQFDNSFSGYRQCGADWTEPAHNYQSAVQAEQFSGTNPPADNSYGDYGQCGTDWPEPAQNYQTHQVGGISPSQRPLSGEPGYHHADHSFADYDQCGSGWAEPSRSHVDQLTVPFGNQSRRASVRARLGAPVNRVRRDMPSAYGSSGQTENGEDVDIPNLKVAILPGDYPSELWTTQQLEAVKKSISDLVQRQGEGCIKPSFAGCIFRNGWLSVKGNDAASVNWLMAMDTRLRPWAGASLKVLPESEVPCNRVFVGLFPALYSTPVKYTLRLIDAHNEGLAVHEWRVLNRVQSGPTMKLAVSIDAHSAEVLKQMHYQLNYGFSRVHFRPRKKAPK
ncbi:hypothetical protein AWZ03_006021 [Drosophila navojoa]|uniref:DUF4780 domain-containing protein n=1 Tax=Drosophila navojoa TaxID=7232 RepID=A0A484BH54_DRONA|nr:hypothetical protein AWZ03_006021 [Drosophila navojoa]